MSQEIGPTERFQYLRELISEASSETPRTMEEGLQQQGAIRFLQRKADELATEVITGD